MLLILATPCLKSSDTVSFSSLSTSSCSLSLPCCPAWEEEFWSLTHPVSIDSLLESSEVDVSCPISSSSSAVDGEEHHVMGWSKVKPKGSEFTGKRKRKVKSSWSSTGLMGCHGRVVLVCWRPKGKGRRPWHGRWGTCAWWSITPDHRMVAAHTLYTIAHTHTICNENMSNLCCSNILLGYTLYWMTIEFYAFFYSQNEQVWKHSQQPELSSNISVNVMWSSKWVVTHKYWF